MFKQVMRMRPSPSMVVALCALFVALSGVAYAGVRANQVGTIHLKNEAVTTPKLADASVEAKKVAKGAIRPAHIARQAIRAGHIAPRHVRAAHISPNAVRERHLAPTSVTNLALAFNSVGELEIRDGAVTTPKLGDGAVTTPKLGDKSVTTAKLGDRSVTTAKLGNKSVRAGKLGDVIKRYGNAVSVEDFVAGDNLWMVGELSVAQCLPGEVALSGGLEWLSGPFDGFPPGEIESFGGIAMVESYGFKVGSPGNVIHQWRSRGAHDRGGTEEYIASVLCLVT